MPNKMKLKISDMILIAILVLVIAGVGYAVYDNAGKIARVSAERKATEAELVKIREKVAGFGKLREEVEANETEMQRIATYIPNQEGQSGFITELGGLTLGSGVKLKGCKAGAEPTPFPNLPEYLVYQWDVSFEALYPQLMQFLESLPVEERSTLVSKINISAGEPDLEKSHQSQYILNVQLTLDLISKSGPEPGNPVAQNGQKKVNQ